jgi:hypothetical protein
MNFVSSTWTTSLAVMELKTFFRATSESIFSTPWRRIAAKIPGPFSAGEVKFFTPKSAGDPYDAPPDLAVGVRGPQGGIFSGAQPVTIHMYVYERGPTRKVVFAAPYGVPTTSKGKARNHVNRFAAALEEQDRQAHEEL